MAKPNRATHGGKGIYAFFSEAEYTAASPSFLLELIGCRSTKGKSTRASPNWRRPSRIG